MDCCRWQNETRCYLEVHKILAQSTNSKSPEMNNVHTNVTKIIFSYISDFCLYFLHKTTFTYSSTIRFKFLEESTFFKLKTRMNILCVTYLYCNSILLLIIIIIIVVIVIIYSR